MALTMLSWYLLTINVVTFAVYAVDKARAIRGEWRVRESTLLALAAAGGSVGALLAMVVCRHKIRKARFAVGVPAMLILQVALVLALLILGGQASDLDWLELPHEIGLRLAQDLRAMKLAESGL